METDRVHVSPLPVPDGSPLPVPDGSPLPVTDGSPLPVTGGRGAPAVPGATMGHSELIATNRSVPKVRSWRRRAPSIAVAGVVLLVAALTVGLAAHANLQQSVISLNGERAKLHNTEAQLTRARSELATVQGQSNAAGHTLSSVIDQLAAAQTVLARAQANLVAQGVSISELDTCLSGVEKSLNQISLGDRSAAAATLSGVAGNCMKAEPSAP